MHLRTAFAPGRWRAAISRHATGATLAFSAAIVFFSATHCAYAAVDWQQAQHDAQRTSRSESALDPAKLALVWSAPGYHEPLIVGNRVFARGPTGAAFDVDTGAVLWQNAAEAGGGRSAYANGMLVRAQDRTVGSNVFYDLRVVDADTGVFKYSVPLPGANTGIVIAPDITTGQPVAYAGGGNRGNVLAIRLGATSGTTLWTSANTLAGGALSILGDSLITAQVDHYYRIDRATGVVTSFKNGALQGGLPTVTVVDAQRNQFYINDGSGLNAFAYNGTGGAITQLWNKTGIARGEAGVAIDSDGHLYTTNDQTLFEIDPLNGDILDSVNNTRYSRTATPVVSANGVFAYVAASGILGPDVIAYSRSTLDPLITLSGDRNTPGTTYSGLGALDDTHFIFDHPDGLRVYQVVPEPTSLWVLVAPAILLRRRQQERERRPNKGDTPAY